MSSAIPYWTYQLPHYIGGAAKWGSWQVQPLMLGKFWAISKTVY